jgi:porin
LACWPSQGQPDKGIGVFFRFGALGRRRESRQVRLQRRHRRQGHRAGTPGRQFRDRLGAHTAQRQLRDVLRQRLDLGLQKEDAIEMYYNAAITKWLTAALDLQIIMPALTKTPDSSGQQLANVNTSVVAGLRIYSRF